MRHIFLDTETTGLYASQGHRVIEIAAIEIINRNGGTAVEFSELHQLVDHPQVKALDLVQHLDGVAYLRAPWAAPWPLPTLAKAQPYVRESTTSRSRAAE